MFLFSSQTTRILLGREKEIKGKPIFSILTLVFWEKKNIQGKLKEEVEKGKGVQREE